MPISTSAQTPPLEALQVLAEHLERANIPFALGGSGLLAILGLIDTVRDWDITTDEPWKKVEPVVRNFDYELIAPNGIFATAYLCKIQLLGASIDLMGNFAIKKPSGEIHHVKTEVTRIWNGIPIGSPREWAIAYELMGRKEKASLLFSSNRLT